MNWSKDSDGVGTNNQLMTNSSGFYCCHVMDNETPMETVLTVCATIVILGTCHPAKQTIIVSTVSLTPNLITAN